MNSFDLIIATFFVWLLATLVMEVRSERARLRGKGYTLGWLTYSTTPAQPEQQAQDETCPSRVFEGPTYIQLCIELERLGYELKDDRVVYMALSYGEQAPCDMLRGHLLTEILCCQDRLAVAKGLKDAIYLESVFGVDDGRDHCEGDQDEYPEPEAQPLTTKPMYWFNGGCAFDVWEFEGAQYIGLRDELLAEVIKVGGYQMYLITVEQDQKWLADDYVADGVLEELVPAVSGLL